MKKYSKIQEGDTTYWYDGSSHIGTVKLGVVDLNSVSADRLFRGLSRLADKGGEDVKDIIETFYVNGYIDTTQVKRVLDSALES